MAYPTITPLPPAPQRGEDFTTFSQKANDFVAAQSAFVTEVNAAGAFMEAQVAVVDQTATDAETYIDGKVVEVNNTVSTATASINQTATDAETYIDGKVVEVDALVEDAEQSAQNAESASSLSQSSANFIGEWSSLSGPASVPSSVYHDGAYWQLLNDLSDVTSSEPGVSADWVPALPGIDSLPASGGQEGDVLVRGSGSGASFGTSFRRYDLASVATTATLDLAASNVFRADASSPLTLSFANEPGAGRAMTVVVHITGNSAVTWPAGIDWDDDSAPELGETFTRVVLFWDGVEWSGIVGAAK